MGEGGARACPLVYLKALHLLSTRMEQASGTGPPPQWLGDTRTTTRRHTNHIRYKKAQCRGVRGCEPPHRPGASVGAGARLLSRQGELCKGVGLVSRRVQATEGTRQRGSPTDQLWELDGDKVLQWHRAWAQGEAPHR